MWSDEQIEYFDRTAGRIHRKEIAAHLGKSDSAVSQYASRKGVSLRLKFHGNEKYSEGQVRDAKALLAEGVRNCLVAEKTGLSKDYVGQLKAGRFRNKRHHESGANPSELWRVALGQAG